MGFGRSSASDWDAFTTATSYHTDGTAKSTAHVFAARGMKDSLNPAKIALRESCDSDINPNSTPIIIGMDVTGSMHEIPRYFVDHGMKALFTEIYDRKPVSDPHVMFMGIGDAAAWDTAPLQVSQFEADIKLADQLVDLYLEGGGGGNSSESYTLPWYFAAMKTSVDSVKKRNKKGYLFTYGDEEPPAAVTPQQLTKVFGPGEYTTLTSEQLLEMASRSYHVFHIVVEQGSHCRRAGADHVVGEWNKVLGQNVLRLSDYKKLSEVIVSVIQVTEGDTVEKVTKSWGGDTSLVVSRAVNGLTKHNASGSDSAVVTF